MPASFWGEAVTTTVFLLNRASTKALSGKTRPIMVASRRLASSRCSAVLA
jgi:hypothetical protein